MMFRKVPNKREFLAKAFERIGVLGLIEQTIARRRPGLMVLTYHRIAETGSGPVLQAGHLGNPRVLSRPGRVAFQKCASHEPRRAESIRSSRVHPGASPRCS